MNYKNIIKADVTAVYLSDVLNLLPSNCLLDKGITGCGGTTLEINSNRDSLILVPNINIVLSKCNQHKNLIGVYGETSYSEFTKLFKSKKKNKKIIATYDALSKIINWVGDSIFDFFLLVDEYHILFNYYRFRHNAISYILDNFSKFKEYCFMTATPLNDNNILKELKYLDKISIEWPQATKVNVDLIVTRFTSKELSNQIDKALKADYNLHIFLNSINTIKSVITGLKTKDYRTVCSKDAEAKDHKLGGKLQVSLITDPIKKINFYTATAFEGSDIYDPKGKTIVVSDTNISTSLIDISTLFIQICGRLRDSIYKDQVTYICNTKTHRYLQYKSIDEFTAYEDELQRKALLYESDFTKLTEDSQSTNIEIFNENPEPFWNRYLSVDNKLIIFDENFRKIDHQNYILVSRVFKNPFNVLMSLKDTNKVNPGIQINPYWEDIFNLLPSLIIDNKQFKSILKQINAPFNVAYAGVNLGDCFDVCRKRENNKVVVSYDFTKLKLLLGK